MKVGGYKLSALEIEAVLLEVCVSFIKFQVKDKKLNKRRVILVYIQYSWYICLKNIAQMKI
jgi:hypothetical protein